MLGIGLRLSYALVCVSVWFMVRVWLRVGFRYRIRIRVSVDVKFRLEVMD